MTEEQPPEITLESLLELKQTELLEFARKLNYPASIAEKKTNKTKLSEMILAGEYEEEVEEVKKDLLMPVAARIVFGGPVVNEKALPFGFSVSEQLSDDEMEKYKVTYHCKQGSTENQSHTYRFVY